MADNPRTQSAKEAMMAEMIITEIDKLSDYQHKILQSCNLLDLKYQQLDILLNEQKQATDKIVSHTLMAGEFITKYATLTNRAVDLSESLIDIQKQGIGVSDTGQKRMISSLIEANAPIKKYLQWQLYGIGVAFFLLLIVAIFI